MEFINTSSLIMFILTIILSFIGIILYFTNHIKIKSILGFNINTTIFILSLLSSIISIILNSIVLHRVKNDKTAETSDNKKLYNKTLTFIIISVILFGIALFFTYSNIKSKNNLLKTNMYKQMMGYEESDNDNY